MKFTRKIAIGVIAASLGLGMVQAKTLRSAGEPAEFPPASFKAKQYVDSRGCVYIRAGIDGLITWIPRVARNRQVLCGYKPSFAEAPAPQITTRVTQKTTQIILAPTQKPAVKPVAINLAKPRVQARKTVSISQPKPKPIRVLRKPVAKPITPSQIVRAPKAQVNNQGQMRIGTKPLLNAVRPTFRTSQRANRSQVNTIATQRKVATLPQVNTPVRRAIKSAPKPAEHVTSCPNSVGISKLYSGSNFAKNPVRCGPQTESPVTYENRGDLVTTPPARKAAVAPKRIAARQTVAQPILRAPQIAPRTAPHTASNNTRVLPRHVYDARQLDPIQKIPRGYRSAWDDDRLNRNRAVQTLGGIAQSDLVWTRTVPRKLYVRTSGLVVNKRFPKLIYPFTNMTDQRRAARTAVISTKSTQPITRAKPTTRKAAPKPQPRISTKAQSPAKRPAARGRFIQVGTFGVIANANKTAARLKAAGMPVQMGKYTKNGKEFRIVLAGPIVGTQIKSALAHARRAGFRDAFIRK